MTGPRLSGLSRGPVWLLPALGASALTLVVLLVLLIPVIPAVTRARLRRRARRCATTPRERSHVAWRHVRDDAYDVGLS